MAEIDFENGRIYNFQSLDLGSGHMAYCRASLIDLYLRSKFHSNRSNFYFLWTDVCTYVRIDIKAGFTRLTGRSRPDNGSQEMWKYLSSLSKLFLSPLLASCVFQLRLFRFSHLRESLLVCCITRGFFLLEFCPIHLTRVGNHIRTEILLLVAQF